MTDARNLWKPGHVSMHDLSAAGRASRKVSPWGRVPFTRAQLRTRRLELIARAANQRPCTDTLR